jgi:hypothetical protein
MKTNNPNQFSINLIQLSDNAVRGLGEEVDESIIVQKVLISLPMIVHYLWFIYSHLIPIVGLLRGGGESIMSNLYHLLIILF